MQDQTIRIEARVGHLHFIDESTGDVIRSFGGRVEGVIASAPFSVNVGKAWLNALGRLRIASRLLRIHRINVLRISKTRLLIIYRNDVFVFKLPTRALTRVHRFPLTHYVHTQSISVHDERIVIGEYGNVGRSKMVGALVSLDGGVSWHFQSLFEQGLVKNILAIQYDEHSQNYWVFTGDSATESGVHLFDKTFKPVKTLGEGLAFRAISAFFLADKVVWLTNNPFGTSMVKVYDRASEAITTGEALPGPVWYSTRLGTDVYACTAAEDVAGEAGDHVYVLHSRDHLHWSVLCQFRKDRMNRRLFLYGLGTFPQTGPSNTSVHLNLDAVEAFDGCVVKLPRPAPPPSPRQVTMSATSPDRMNPTRLLSLLTDPAWAGSDSPLELSDEAYEYLLRFCEVNRHGLVERIEKERAVQPTPVLIYRISQLLLKKWDSERDYRFLNLLYKFKTKHYLEHFPKDVASAALRSRLDQALSRELHHD